MPKGQEGPGGAPGDLERGGTAVGRLDHVGVAVRDASSTAATLSRTLGLRIELDEVLENIGVRLVYMVGADEDGQCPVQLVQPLRDGPVLSFLDERGEGPHHLCFTSLGLEDALVAVNDNEATIFAGGRGRRACFLTQQLSGMRVELVEPVPSSPGGHP